MSNSISLNYVEIPDKFSDDLFLVIGATDISIAPDVDDFIIDYKLNIDLYFDAVEYDVPELSIKLFSFSEKQVEILNKKFNIDKKMKEEIIAERERLYAQKRHDMKIWL